MRVLLVYPEFPDTFWSFKHALKFIHRTRLYERMKREDRLTGEWTGDNVDGSTNIIPRMGPEALRQRRHG